MDANFSFFFITTILILVFSNVEGRVLNLDGLAESEYWISDGVDDQHIIKNNQSDYLSLKKPISSGESCKHIYGFFPCAENIGGYIFMIATFQYLLVLGEKVLSTGSNRLFSILDTGIFGASIFPTLITWPRVVMAFVSGLLVSREAAQVSVSSSLGSNVGSSVLNLTVLWGICVILGRQNISANSNATAESSSSNFNLEDLKGTGIKTNKLTGYIAGVMLVSLTPFTIMLLADFISSPIGKRITILVALIVSVTLLLSYFAYQMWNPLIQKKTLEYIKHENLVKVFVQHIQRQARGNLFKGGVPDINVLKGLFTKTDKDRNKSITVAELEELVHKLDSGNVKVDRNFALSTLSKTFDQDGDKRINEQEFIEGCKKLIEESKDDSTSTKKLVDQVLEAYNEGKQKEILKIQELMPRVLKQIQIIQAIESEGLQNDDGSLNIESIKRTSTSKENPEATEEHRDMVLWGEAADKFFDEAQTEKYEHFDHSLVLKWKICKSVLQVILGIAILTLCADPVMDNVTRLANAIGVPSFFLSFVVIPLAINARTAIQAISLLSSTSEQSSRTSSLTFSEIYVRVILNNIMGMSTVLAVLYAKDLSWNYSQEVLISMVVCALTSLFAFTRTTYPLWTCILAFLLYPISLVLLYIFQL